MGDRASVEKIVKEVYAARKAKDLDAIVSMFTPNATFRPASSPAAVNDQAKKATGASGFLLFLPMTTATLC